MAVSTIPLPIPKPTAISVTPSAGSNYTPYGGCYYSKIGSLVHVHVGVSGLTANTNQTVFVLPDGYRPKADLIVSGKNDSTAIVGSAMAVKTDGDVIVRTQGTYAGADAMFFVY